MTTKEQWRKRVADWRASGKSSEVFATDRAFTAAGLRCMAHRLEKEPAVGVRMARAEVVLERPDSRRRTGGTPVVVRVGEVEVEVSGGFEPETLAAVVGALEGRRR